jgi:type IV pilus assembly protein PilM
MFGKAKDLVGVDIGSSSIKLVELKQSRDSYVLKNVGMLTLPPEAIVDNTLMDTSSIVEVLRDLVRVRGVKLKDAACSISGNSVIIRKIVLPTMNSEQLEEQIHYEAEQYIPFDINDVHIDFQILGPDPNDLNKILVLLVASKKDIINDYAAVFTESGLKMVVADVDSFAIQNAFEINYSPGEDEMVALINIGASMTNLNIVKGGASLFTRDMQTGGNSYTEEIQKQFGTGREEAEKIKISGRHPQQARLQEIYSRVNDSLANEMRRSLDFYLSTAMDDRVSKVYLSGGCSRVPNLVDVVGQRLSLSVEILNPFRRIKYNEKEFEPDYIQQIAPSMAVAVGLAMRRVGDK